MLIARHRRVTDPYNPFLKYARQPGFYMHLPKYWSCYGYDFDSFWKKETTEHRVRFPENDDEFGGKEFVIPAQYSEDDDWIISLKRNANENRAAHARCHPWTLHRSHVGYMRWTSRRRSWTWFYQGNPYRPGSNLERSTYEPRESPVVYHKGDTFEWARMEWTMHKRAWQGHVRQWKRGWAERHPQTPFFFKHETRTR
jgi:hypothetical protein